MIPVPRLREPPDFDSRVRKPGQAWLASNPQHKRPKALWVPFTSVLGAGCLSRCGYAAMIDYTGGTIDHYLSVKSRRDLTYDWDNYRFACATMNSCKRNADDSILDPQEVKSGWFEILLPSLQLQVTNKVPKAMRKKALFTLQRLKLGDGERVLRWRQSWYRLYLDDKLSLEGLRNVAPLIADAVERSSSTARQKRR